jgi:hypothetical protein
LPLEAERADDLRGAGDQRDDALFRHREMVTRRRLPEQPPKILLAAGQ